MPPISHKETTNNRNVDTHVLESCGVLSFGHCITKERIRTMAITQKIGATLIVVIALLSCIHEGQSWTTHSPVTPFRANVMSRKTPTIPVSSMRTKVNTKLSMYNLPPGGGGGGGKSDLAQLATSVGLFALTIAFFLSPLGGFVLTIMNSFLLLALLVPILGVVGFQAWQFFNTIKGPCPNCGAPVQVLKSQPNGQDVPSICYSCGAIIQANYENTGIDNVTGRNTIDDQSSPFGSLFDIFGGQPSQGGGGTTTTTRTTIVDTTVIVEDDDDEDDRNPRTKKFGKSSRGNDGVIDVDASDQPFQ